MRYYYATLLSREESDYQCSVNALILYIEMISIIIAICVYDA